MVRLFIFYMYRFFFNLKFRKKIRGYALIGAAGSSVAVLLSSFPELLSSVELQPKSARDITISRVPSKRVVFSL